MSRFDEFCESLRLGKAKTEEEQLRREELERTLPMTVGALFQRLCDRFRCPREQAHYVDLRTNTVAGPIHGSAPPIRFNPQGGSYDLGLEILVGEPGADCYPLWLRFEFAPQSHGGVEFRFASALFQLPAEEDAFFDHVANVINEELREGCTPSPHLLGY